MVAWSGVRLGGDSGIYIDGAHALLNGQPLTVREPSYAGYIAFVAFFQATGAGLVGLVLGQVAAATAAAYAVYLIARQLGGPLAASVSVVMATIDFDTNRWHAFVLSDSLYASVLVVATWLVYVAARKPQASSPKPQAPSLKACAAATLVLVAPQRASSRPMSAGGPDRSSVLVDGSPVIGAGVAVGATMVAGAGVAVGATIVTGAGVAAVGAGCLLLVALMAPRLSGNAEAVGPGEMLARGQTIWEYDGWGLSMPAASPAAGEYGSAGRAIRYALQHPAHTAALMAARAGVHFAHVRPYFSPSHNAVIVLWLLPLYALALHGWWRLRGHPDAGRDADPRRLGRPLSVACVADRLSHCCMWPGVDVESARSSPLCGPCKCLIRVRACWPCCRRCFRRPSSASPSRCCASIARGALTST